MSPQRDPSSPISNHHRQHRRDRCLASPGAESQIGLGRSSSKRALKDMGSRTARSRHRSGVVQGLVAEAYARFVDIVARAARWIVRVRRLADGGSTPDSRPGGWAW
jgi:hypothetical protein